MVCCLFTERTGCRYHGYWAVLYAFNDVPLFLQIFGGWVSDSLGRLRAIAIGSVFGVLGYIPLLLADTWQWLLLATWLLVRGGAFIVGPSFDAFIAEHSSGAKSRQGLWHFAGDLYDRRRGWTSARWVD
jgi:MFS family permease